MLQYDEFALVLISEIFSQYGSWLWEDLCVYCSKLSFIVQLLLINYSSDISAFMDKTSLTLCQSTPYQITKAADSEDADYDKVITRYKAEGLGDNWAEYMKIVPVNFNKEVRQTAFLLSQGLQHRLSDSNLNPKVLKHSHSVWVVQFYKASYTIQYLISKI
jgi:hypothetical protein